MSNARADSARRLESPLGAAGIAIQRIHGSRDRGDEHAIPDDGWLRSRHGDRAQIERPFQLELGHVGDREARRGRILESRVGHARAPAVPPRRIRGRFKSRVSFAGPVERDRRRLRAAGRGDVAQQREDLRRGQALRPSLHAAAGERKIDGFSAHGLDRAQRRHAPFGACRGTTRSALCKSRRHPEPERNRRRAEL